MSDPRFPSDDVAIKFKYGDDITGPQLVIAIPPAKCVLLIGDMIRIESRKPLPSLWRRFWYRLLLGWRWEKL